MCLGFGFKSSSTKVSNGPVLCCQGPTTNKPVSQHTQVSSKPNRTEWGNSRRLHFELWPNSGSLIKLWMTASEKLFAGTREFEDFLTFFADFSWICVGVWFGSSRVLPVLDCFGRFRYTVRDVAGIPRTFQQSEFAEQVFWGNFRLFRKRTYSRWWQLINPTAQHSVWREL